MFDNDLYLMIFQRSIEIAVEGYKEDILLKKHLFSKNDNYPIKHSMYDDKDDDECDDYSTIIMNFLI